MENDLRRNGEMVLADVLDNVLKNLNACDLCRAAQVCKSWNHTVKLEFFRRGPERILIPTNPCNSALEDSQFRVANILSAKPNVVVLFCGPKPHFRNTLDLEVDILSAYNNRLPAGTKLIIVGVDNAMIDEAQILSCPTLPFNKSGDFNILGLALPNYRDVKIDVAYCVSHEIKSRYFANQVAKELIPEITDHKFILIMFGRSQYSVSKEVLNIIKSTCKSRSYTLWGGTTENYLKVIDCRVGDFPSYMGMQGVICIKITGQGLESHTTVVSYALKFSEIKDKLLAFKRKLKLRRHKLGMVCGSDSCVNNSKLMEAIREVFPGVSFASFFNVSGQFFGFDSTSDDPDQELMHTDSMSIMILTYD